MSVAFFKGALTFALWSRAKENPKVNNDPIKECRRLFETLSRFQTFIAVPDKHDILEGIEKDLSSPDAGLFMDKRFKDSDVLAYLEKTLQGSSEDDLRKFLQTVVIILFQDCKISELEKENLYLFGDHFSISKEDIDGVIDETKKSQLIKKEVVTDERIKTRQDKIVSTILVVIGLLIIFLAGFGLIKYFQAIMEIRDFDLGKYVEQNPRLVFRKVIFSKYIAYGTPPDVNSHLAKLYVYHVKGSADFQLNLKNLEVNTKKTDYVSKQLYLMYHYSDSSQIPIEVDVHIAQKDFNKIEEIDAEPISEGEAKAVAKAVAVPAGILGAYVGGKIGGMFKMPFVGNVVSGFLGAGAGGAAASTGAYIMTSHFLTNLKVSGNSLGEQEILLNAAKPMIAMELTGGTMWDKDSWNEDIRRYYEKELNDRLQEVFQGLFGWETVIIEYPSLMGSRS